MQTWHKSSTNAWGRKGKGKYLFSHASIRGTTEELDDNRFYENSEKRSNDAGS